MTYRHSGAGMTPQKCPFLLTPCLFLRRQESREAQPVVLSHCAPPESPPHPCRGTACRARDPWLRGVLPTPRGGESSQRNPRGGGQPPFLCPRKELPRLRHSDESRLCVCQVCDLTWLVNPYSLTLILRGDGDNRHDRFPLALCSFPLAPFITPKAHSVSVRSVT